jgi:hypothetical protein
VGRRGALDKNRLLVEKLEPAVDVLDPYEFRIV